MISLDFILSERLQRVLGAVLLDPELELTLSDLIRRAGSGRGATQVVVENLVKAGIVTDRRRGNQRLFRANEKHPIYPELRSIAVKTFGLADRVGHALRKLGDKIDFAFIFGSFANGTQRPDSDIDLMVVGAADLFLVTEALTEAEGELRRPIHVNIYDLEEWQCMQRDKLITKIVNGPKIMVIGNEPSRDHATETTEPDPSQILKAG